MRCSRTEAPSLRRRYPASPVLRASPPPCAARPDPRGLSVGVCYATGRASRVASIPLLHTCRRHYPGGTGRCSRRSLPDRWQPSPYSGRVGFRITRFEACAAFTRVAARVVAEPPHRQRAVATTVHRARRRSPLRGTLGRRDVFMESCLQRIDFTGLQRTLFSPTWNSLQAPAGGPPAPGGGTPTPRSGPHAKTRKPGYL